jgi:hypothetical protein
VLEHTHPVPVYSDENLFRNILESINCRITPISATHIGIQDCFDLFLDGNVLELQHLSHDLFAIPSGRHLKLLQMFDEVVVIFVCEPPARTLSINVDDLDDVLLQRLALCRSKHLGLGTKMSNHVSTGFGPEENRIDSGDVGGECSKGHLVPYLRLGSAVMMGGVSIDKHNWETRGLSSGANTYLRVHE